MKSQSNSQRFHVTGGFAATAAGLLVTTGSHAAIVYTNLSSPLTISTANTSNYIYFDLDRSSAGPVYARTTTFTGNDFQIYSFATEKPTIASIPATGGVMLSGNNAAKLALGSSISASGTFTQKPFIENGDIGAWHTTEGEGYLGLRLPATGGSFYYGWALIDYRDAGNTLTLKSFAYENVADTAIAAGAGASAIPEPANAAALSALIAGSTLLRSRRRVVRADPNADV